MAIERFGDYEQTQAYGDFKQLPRGGYVLKIMGAKIEENQYGQRVMISCDISEGEYANFFADDYKNQKGNEKKWRCVYRLTVPKDDGTERDNWDKRRFKTFTETLEECNPGYHFDWDEQKFKGKIIGGLFNRREFQKNNGDIGEAMNFAQVCSVEKIRSGEYRIPNDRRLPEDKRKKPEVDTSFIDIPDSVTDDELPFD